MVDKRGLVAGLVDMISLRFYHVFGVRGNDMSSLFGRYPFCGKIIYTILGLQRHPAMVDTFFLRVLHLPWPP